MFTLQLFGEIIKQYYVNKFEKAERPILWRAVLSQ